MDFSFIPVASFYPSVFLLNHPVLIDVPRPVARWVTPTRLLIHEYATSSSFRQEVAGLSNLLLLKTSAYCFLWGCFILGDRFR